MSGLMICAAIVGLIGGFILTDLPMLPMTGLTRHQPKEA